MSAAIDAITILTSQGPLATKRITATRGGKPTVEPYGLAKVFDIAEVAVSNIDDLAALLARAEQMPRSFIVHGKPREGAPLQRVLRRVRDQRNADGTVSPATLQEQAHHWIPLDVDQIDCPDWLDPLHEPDQTVEHVVERLPAEFHNATVVWQFTSSAGIKPGISLRLFFWADRPLVDWELKRWLADSPVDHSIFAPAQPIYVARPIFVGMPDPVPFRSGIWRGDRDAITPPVITKPSARASTGHTFTGSAGGGYDFYRSRIGDHTSGDGFFKPVKAAVASWIARQGAGVDTSWLRADLERVIRNAPRDPEKHDDYYVERRIEDLDPLIRAILALQAAKEAQAAAPPQCEPTYPVPLASVGEAERVLVAAMDDFAFIVMAAGSEPLALAA